VNFTHNDKHSASVNNVNNDESSDNDHYDDDNLIFNVNMSNASLPCVNAKVFIF
jgi:hypothetical protein